MAQGVSVGLHYSRAVPATVLSRAKSVHREVRQWWKRKQPVRIARALVAKDWPSVRNYVLTDGVDFNHQFTGTPLTRQKQARWPVGQALTALRQERQRVTGKLGGHAEVRIGVAGPGSARRIARGVEPRMVFGRSPADGPRRSPPTGATDRTVW